MGGRVVAPFRVPWRRTSTGLWGHAWMRPATFTPTSITGLRAWWDASDTATITQSGGLVSQWNDKSGNGFHLTQDTGSNQPTTGTRTINSLNVLDFVLSGDDWFDAVNASTIMGASSAGTALYIYARDADAAVGSGDAGAVLGTWGTSGSDDHEPWTDSTVYHGWGATARKTVGDPAPSLVTPRQITIKTASGAWSYAIDGTNVFSTGTNTVGWSSSAYVGRSGAGVGGAIDGRIGEILLYDTALSGTNLTDAQNYLKNKWGTA